jgi:predicted small lipoprotein YifL
MLRLAIAVCLAVAVSACGTKGPLLTPQCSKEERAANGTPAPANADATCGKLSRLQKNPSEPPNPISR